MVEQVFYYTYHSTIVLQAKITSRSQSAYRFLVFMPNKVEQLRASRGKWENPGPFLSAPHPDISTLSPIRTEQHISIALSSRDRFLVTELQSVSENKQTNTSTNKITLPYLLTLIFSIFRT